MRTVDEQHIILECHNTKIEVGMLAKEVLWDSLSNQSHDQEPGCLQMALTQLMH